MNQLHGLLHNSSPMALQAGVNGVRVGRGPHLEPGLVTYEAVYDEAGNLKRPKITYLLTREAIERGRPTAASKPLVGKSGEFNHIPSDPKTKQLPPGEYDGAAVESYASSDGYEWLLFQVTDQSTAKACEDGFQFSCGYYPTEVDETPGVWHGTPYDAVIKDLTYTHFALVENPRYDAARDGKQIEILNSLPKDKPTGGPVKDSIVMKVLAKVVGADKLRELLNAAEAEEKKSADEGKREESRKKAKADLDNSIASAKTAEERMNAMQAYNAAMEAADEPGHADEAAKRQEQEAQHAERKNRISLLRNAADAIEKLHGPEKAMEYRNEADSLEKQLPLGGGDVPKDPGVAQPVTERKNEVGAASEQAAKVSGAAPANPGPAAQPPKAFDESRPEHVNAIEAWPAYMPDMLPEDVAKLVLCNSADHARPNAPKAFSAQPAKVKEAWCGVFKDAKGTDLDERCNSLRTVAQAKVTARAEALREADAKKKFEELQNAAAKRDSDGLGSLPHPLMGESMEEKAARGEEMYGGK